MRPAICFLFVLTLSIVSERLYAEVEVTLKSGASLIGQVSIDGDSVVVTIDDSPLRVPLAEVDTIASADAGPERQARRLLLTALEARLTNDAGVEVVGLLAEAARLAPDDPHIAYWYAFTLADAGYGRAASDIFERHRDALTKAYPGLAQQLVERIQRRVEMEMMPPDLVQQIDQLNAAASQQPGTGEMRPIYAVFRLVDQDERGIDRSAFHVRCNGQDERLESFDDGYYMFTYNLHRNNDEQPCHVEVVRPGLEAKSFTFSGSSNRVQDAGEFVVQRFDEKAKRPVRIALTTPAGEPVAGAQVTLQPVSPSGQSSNQTLSEQSDGKGVAEVLAFPMRYSYRVQAEGYNHASGDLEVKSGDDSHNELQVQLYPAIRATIRVAWQGTAMQGGGKTSGETTLEVDGSPPRPYVHGQDMTSWIRPVQEKDRLTLQFIEYPYGFGGPFGAPEAWIREARSKTGAAESDGQNAELDEFNSIDLNKIEDLKDKLPTPRTTTLNQPGNPRPATVLSPAPRGVYVGRLQHRDVRTGQPLQLAYKVFIEEMQ